MRSNVLLHSCCAVCAGYPIEKLRENGFEPAVYFFNPNIYPESEYHRRLGELVRYCGKKDIELIIEPEEHLNWLDYVKGLENEPEKGARCLKCFEYRLLHAAKKSAELGINKFASTLTVSPHKNSKMVFAAGKTAADNYKIEFLEMDFKKQNGFLKTMKIAKEENFYRQTYCGCEFSFNKPKSCAVSG